MICTSRRVQESKRVTAESDFVTIFGDQHTDTEPRPQGKDGRVHVPPEDERPINVRRRVIQIRAIYEIWPPTIRSVFLRAFMGYGC